MASVAYPIRVDEDIKKSAAHVAEFYGFDLASVTRAFWRQMIRTNSIPLSLSNEEPNEESLEAIRETEDILKKGGVHRFKSTEELIASLEEA